MEITDSMVTDALGAEAAHVWSATTKLCTCGEWFNATLDGHALFARHKMRATLAAALEDQGDGTAPPEENFWDDRTTPHAYGATGSERDMALRRNIAAAALRDAASDFQAAASAGVEPALNRTAAMLLRERANRLYGRPPRSISTSIPPALEAGL